MWEIFGAWLWRTLSVIRRFHVMRYEWYEQHEDKRFVAKLSPRGSIESIFHNHSMFPTTLPWIFEYFYFHFIFTVFRLWSNLILCCYSMVSWGFMIVNQRSKFTKSSTKIMKCRTDVFNVGKNWNAKWKMNNNLSLAVTSHLLSFYPKIFVKNCTRTIIYNFVEIEKPVADFCHRFWFLKNRCFITLLI